MIKTQYSGGSFSPSFQDGMFKYRISAPIIKPRVKWSVAQRHIIEKDLNRFDVRGDFEIFNEILNDMRANAGSLEPIAHWHVQNAGGLVDGAANVDAAIAYKLSRDEFDDRYGNLTKMLDPYVGGHGLTNATPGDVVEYERFLKAVDHLDLLSGVSLSDYVAEQGLLVTDLGSIWDVNALLGYILPRDQSSVQILEIGGGYGRLAEVVCNLIPGKIKYVLSDSVPASLMFAFMYLKKRLPWARIGAHYMGDAIDDDFDIYIVPTWELLRISRSFDAAICIEAFQEMNKVHVDAYTNYFEDCLGEGGLVYISGSWRYVNKESYDFSSKFQTIWLGNTPRSWSYVHPSHLLRKGNGNYFEINDAFLRHFAANC